MYLIVTFDIVVQDPQHASRYNHQYIGKVL